MLATADATISDQKTKGNPRVSRFYAPELDALRFGAFVLVFCRHVVSALGDARRASFGAPETSSESAAAMTFLSSSARASAARWTVLQESLQAFDFGVCLFFFLSAFLITRLLLTERRAMGTVGVRNFYIRRALRIWPLYYSFLLVVPLLSLGIPVLHVSGWRLGAAALFVGNWSAVLHGWSSISIQPLWSVSVEEQFYAVWPWLARFGRRTVIGLSIVLVGVSLGTLAYLGHRSGTKVTTVWPNTLVQALFLACGALTACLSYPEHRRLSEGARMALLLSGLVAWIGASAGCHAVRTLAPGAPDLVAGYLLILLGTFLIFTGVAGWNRCELPHTLLLLGRMSYGLYVFHGAVLLALGEGVNSFVRSRHLGLSPLVAVLLASVFGFVLTVLLAALSYRFLETPYLKLKDRFALVASRPV